MLTLRGVSEGRATLSAIFWLLHPFSIQVSTRGNADGIVCALVLATVYCIMAKRVVAGGFCWVRTSSELFGRDFCF